MRGTCLTIQCLLLTFATISAKLPNGLGILRAFDLPQLRPRYQREEGGLTSTLRMLGDLGSKIFDNALRRINLWNMHPKPSYNSMDMIPAHEKNLPHDYPPDLNVAGSDHYQDAVMPSYVNPAAQDWWEDPFCSECYDYSDLLRYLPSDYGGLRVNYDNGAQISQPKLVYKQVIGNHHRKRNYRGRKPTTVVPKLINGWNPIPSANNALGYQNRRPTYSPLDSIKQTSVLLPAVHRPNYHKLTDNVKQTPKNVMKVIKPPIQTKKEKTPLTSQHLWREVDTKRIKNKPSRGSFVDHTTPRPLTATRNATKYSH